MTKRIGTLLPLSALRSSALGSTADGTFAAAMPFLVWLHSTGQTVWQLLPLSQPHLQPGFPFTHVPSPYKGYGVGIDPRYLSVPWSALQPTAAELVAFQEAHADWLPVYALFCALRDRYRTDDWTRWPAPLRDRDSAALEDAGATLAAEVHAHVVTQWRLATAFGAVRARAKELGIALVGDMPFYLPLQSPLVWAHRTCFDIAENGALRSVSGVPEGQKSHYGRQVWGHPLYDWQRDAAGVTALWELRLRLAAQMYDAVRLDHAKGFFNFGAMDVNGPSGDEVRTGPGGAVLERLIAFVRARGADVMAEDAGDRLEELRQTLHANRVAGIRMLRFAYNEKRKTFEDDYADLARYPDHCYAYSSTHDTEPLAAYAAALSARERDALAARLHLAGVPEDAGGFAAALRNALLASPAGTVILPLQDWLGTTSRINVPGTEVPVNDPNWRYQMEVPIEQLPDRAILAI